MAQVKDGFKVTLGVVLALFFVSVILPMLITLFMCGGCAALVGVGTVGVGAGAGAAAIDEAKGKAKQVAQKVNPNPANPAAAAAAIAQAVPAARVIPGMNSVDVHLNLTNRGFKREGPIQGDGYVANELRLTDVDSEMFCRIVGTDVANVTSINATFTNLGFPPERTGELAEEFLGYIASVPFTGADPQANKIWVSQNIDGGKTTVAGVSFEIHATTPRARTLTIELAKKPEPRPGNPEPLEMPKPVQPTDLTEPPAEPSGPSAKLIQEAERAYDLARRLMDKPTSATAGKARMREIVEKYPGTPAAAKAAKLLGE